MIADDPSAATEAVDSRRVATRGSLGQGATVLTVASLLGSVLNLGTAIIASRLYGPAIVGEFALVLAPWGMLVRISTIGEQLWFTRLASITDLRTQALGGLFRSLFWFSSAVTAGVAVLTAAATVGLFLGPIGRPQLIAPACVLLVGYVVIDNIGWNLETLLTATGQFGALSWSRLGQGGSILAATWLLTIPLRSVWGLTVATLLGFAVQLLIRLPAAVRVLPKRLDVSTRRGRLRQFHELRTYTAPFIPASAMTGIFGQAPTMVLGASSSNLEVGVFSRAVNITLRFQELVFRLSGSMMAHLSQARAEGVDVFRATARRVIVAAILVAGLPCAFLASSAESVLRVFGAEFAKGATTLVIMTAAVFFGTVDMALLAAIVSIDRPRAMAWSSTIGQSLGLLSLFPLVAIWGANGAAGAQLVGALTVCAAYALVLLRSGHGPVLRVRILPAAGVIASALAAGILSNEVLAYPADLAAAGVSVPVVFGMVCLLTGLVTLTQIRAAQHEGMALLRRIPMPWKRSTQR